MAEDIDLETIESLKELMKDKFSMLVETYVENAEKYIVAIENGFEERSAKKIRDAAHPLKGSSGNLGLVALSETAGQLEKLAKDALDGNASIEDAQSDVERLRALFSAGRSGLESSI